MVDGDGRLARLAVADDQLTLAAADGDHGVHGLEARLQRLLHGLAEHHARSLALQRHLESLARQLALAVEGLAQRIDDAAEERLVDLDGGNAAGALGNHALAHLLGAAEKHGAHIVFLQVHDHGHDAVLKLQQFAHLGIPESVEAGHAVAYGQHGAHLLEAAARVDVVQLLQEHFTHFAGFDFVHTILLFLSMK